MRQVACVMTFREGLVLAVRRPDGRWALPGGFVELERIVDAARREMFEETGYRAGEMYVVLRRALGRGRGLTIFWAPRVDGRLTSSDEGLAEWVPRDWLVHPETGAFAECCRSAYMVRLVNVVSSSSP